MNYIGPEEDPHARMFPDLFFFLFTLVYDNLSVMLTFSLSDDHDHGHHHPPHVEPKTFADYVKPDYWYR